MTTEPCPGAVAFVQWHLLRWSELGRLGVDIRNPGTPTASAVSLRMNQGDDPNRYVDHNFYGPRISGAAHRLVFPEFYS